MLLHAALPSSPPERAVSETSAPVGVFDSGLGGLSVLRAVRAALPHEPLVYVADSLYAPYGERDDDFIVDRTMAIGEWLVARGAKALVVACNTATAQSIALVRERLAIPLIGVEPGVKPAALVSKTRVVGVLATAVTLAQPAFPGVARPLRRRLPLHLPTGPRTRAGRRALRYRLARTDRAAGESSPADARRRRRHARARLHALPFSGRSDPLDRGRPAADRRYERRDRAATRTPARRARSARPSPPARPFPVSTPPRTANPSASSQPPFSGSRPGSSTS